MKGKMVLGVLFVEKKERGREAGDDD